MYTSTTSQPSYYFMLLYILKCHYDNNLNRANINFKCLLGTNSSPQLVHTQLSFRKLARHFVFKQNNDTRSHFQVNVKINFNTLLTQINVTERSTSNFSAQSVSVSHSKIHGCYDKYPLTSRRAIVFKITNRAQKLVTELKPAV